MDLQRNGPAGQNKYIVIKTAKLEGNPRTPEELAAAILKNPEAVEFGDVGSENEFFVVMLKDQHAPFAIEAYANSAYRSGDVKFGDQLFDMADRSGVNHPHCKKPD